MKYKLKYKYAVEIYAGRTYCGNGLFNTREECLEFADDGFCTRAIILNFTTGEKETIRFPHPEKKEDEDAKMKAFIQKLVDSAASAPKHYSRNPLDDIDLEEEDEDD